MTSKYYDIAYVLYLINLKITEIEFKTDGGIWKKSF